jgi:hypothetical protein
LYGCEIESLTLRKEHRLKVSENGAMKRRKKQDRENCIVRRNFIIYISHQILLG